VLHELTVFRVEDLLVYVDPLRVAHQRNGPEIGLGRPLEVHLVEEQRHCLAGGISTRESALREQQVAHARADTCRRGLPVFAEGLDGEAIRQLIDGRGIDGGGLGIAAGAEKQDLGQQDDRGLESSDATPCLVP